MQPKAPLVRVLTLTALICLAAGLARATTTNMWTGGGGGDKTWAASANWSASPLSGDAVALFTNLAVTGTMGPSGTPNSIVSADQTIQGLYCYNTNTSTGAGHTIQINPGVSLIITGSVSPVVFIGAGNAFDAGKDATNYTTILGAGSLIITNPAGDFFIRQVSGTDGKHYATLDLSGLNTFTGYINRITVGATTGSGINTRAGGALRLAKTNVIVCSYTATAGQGLLIGEAQSQNSTTVPQALYLGQTNAIFSDAGITVARQKATGWLGFNTNLVMNNPFVLFRDRVGTGRQGTWLIGEHATSGTSTGNKGIADFSYGTVDALVDTMYVGRGQTGAGAAGQGWLLFTNGTIDVNSLNIGYERFDGSAGKGWVYVDGSAQLTVNNNLVLGNTIGAGSAPSLGVLFIGTNVPGGSVWVKGDIIDGGFVAGSGDLVYVNGGSLKVSGRVGTTNALQNMYLNNAKLTFDCGGNGNPTTSLWQVVALTINGPVTANVEGSAFAVGQFPLLSYNPGFLVGDPAAFALGSLPSHVEGYLSNNTANSSIDLVITKVVALKWNGQTNGVPAGNWDINVTANWLPVSGGAALTYTQPSIPGDQVFFDDTAAGSTTVNMTATLAPYSLNINNSSKNYEFTGVGGLTGSTGLNKNGTGTLTFSNTGTNDFTGVVAINGGTVRLSGSPDRLPTNAAVTIADGPGAALDLNGQNQTIGSLSGGGSTGGNVSLGAGTLSINGDGGIYSGVITGSGGVVKSGTGTQTFNVANSYSGGTVVSGGTLLIANSDGSGIGSGSITVQTNGTLRIGDGGVDGSIAANIITNYGYVMLNRGDDLTWTKLIIGTGGFYKYGANTVTITNPNPYSGTATIAAGTMHITDPGALGTGTIAIANATTARLELPGGLTISQPISISQKPAASGTAPAILLLDGTNVLSGAITGAGGGTYWTIEIDAGKLVVANTFTFAGSSGQGVLRLTGNGDCDWQGNVVTPAGYAGTAWLTMNSTGTWTLSGSNTINGKVTVSSGQFVVNGSLLGSTNISINGGTFAGSGVVNGPVYVGDTLSPGGSAIGTLTINNSLMFSNTATALMQVSHSAYDRVAGSTSVTLGGMLRVTVTGTLVGGEAFKLFEGTSYTGDFATYDLPALDSPLSWDTSAVAVNGTLRVAGSTAPQIASATMTPDHNFQLSGTGPAGQPYWIVATTNVATPLSQWVPLATNTFVGGVFTWTDLQTTNHPRRFYQVVTQSP
jgi:fibronectin-binding autotransporter adhesin